MGGVVVGVGCVLVGTNVTVNEVGAVGVHSDVTPRKRDVALFSCLDLAAFQYQTRIKGLLDVVVVLGSVVGCELGHVNKWTYGTYRSDRTYMTYRYYKYSVAVLKE